MFAYGHNYLSGEGDMILIYPKTEKFSETLRAFEFSANLRLWVTPFDLENDQKHWPSGIKTGIPCLYSLWENEIPQAESQLGGKALA
jgi:5-methylcytosine-specific restriction enzyme subunit McrC